MARTFYHDFLAGARDALGLSYRDAVVFYRDLRTQGFERGDLTDLLDTVEEVDDGREWFYDASDAWEYGLDDYWDAWIDEGEEVELTVYYPDE